MSLNLFPHNLNAYHAVQNMLADTGKAAVIHPTGTGKSYIGFKLCEDNPESRICWLSPSEYIFNTQLEKLGDDVPGNITFLTYARLSILADDLLAEIRPDYIILDEFHRCGAEVWGLGVDKLLKAYPGAPVLGLSATNIRYLDNQRDMADELFDGNVASEMTLGEAIARGILQAPRYVISVYSIQKQLDQLRSRIEKAKNPAVTESARTYLDALRRALDKADGLDVVFDRHMTNRTGKYLLFCSNHSHLRTIRKLLPQWLGRIDAAPHIYTAYSKDPETSKAYRDFKADSSDHIKILCCIDMFNEGVHVADVSGVILVRPTISPIVYKQQIGRALSTSGSSEAPVIFDLVNNFENLYSIRAIQDEMNEFSAIYGRVGETSGDIVRSRFEVIDETRDCREIFNSLNDALSASWDTMFEYAKLWYREHGDLEIPSMYKTPEGYNLGHWLLVQRQVKSGSAVGLMTQERIDKLNSIGMNWEFTYERSWDKHIRIAQKYYEEHGDLNLPTSYIAEGGFNLGQWLCRLRQARSGTMRGIKLTPERIAMLDGMGMVWDRVSYTQERYYAACVEYHKSHGNLEVPDAYTTTDGLRLGRWLNSIRLHHTGKVKVFSNLEQDIIDRLEKLGIQWNPSGDKWENGFKHAEDYKKAYGHLNVARGYICEDGFKLGEWIYQNSAKSRMQHASYKKLERMNRLLELGLKPRSDDPKGEAWDFRYGLVKQYYEQHGTLRIPGSYKAEGINLSSWLTSQRAIRDGRKPGKLTQDQVDRLDALGMDWHPDSWEKMYQRFASGEDCSQWLYRQRVARKKGKLTDDQITRLDALGMKW